MTAFHEYHDLDEGGLTRIKVALVSGSSLSDVASGLGFADCIVFGLSETGTGRRGLHSALENVYEPENPKSALQEKLQEDGITPTYKLIDTQGPPHDRMFVAQVFAGEKGLAQGTGRTKKEAESQAARSTLERLGDFFGLGLTPEAKAEKQAAAAKAKAEKQAAAAKAKAEKQAAAAKAKAEKQARKHAASNNDLSSQG